MLHFKEEETVLRNTFVFDKIHSFFKCILMWNTNLCKTTHGDTNCIRVKWKSVQSAIVLLLQFPQCNSMKYIWLNAIQWNVTECNRFQRFPAYCGSAVNHTSTNQELDWEEICSGRKTQCASMKCYEIHNYNQGQG